MSLARRIARRVYGMAYTRFYVLATRLLQAVSARGDFRDFAWQGMRVREFANSQYFAHKWINGLTWFTDLRALAAASAESPVVMDVGANIGIAAVTFATIPGARVLAFEPESENAALLRHNVETNGLAARVTVVEAGLSDIRQTLRVGAGAGGDRESVFVQTGGDGVESHFEALDDVLAEQGIDRLDFLKIDTEGFDVHVLRGAAASLARHRPVMVVEFVTVQLARYGENWDSFLAAIAPGDYALFEPARHGWRPARPEVLSATVSTNLLLLPRGARAAAGAAAGLVER